MSAARVIAAEGAMRDSGDFSASIYFAARRQGFDRIYSGRTILVSRRCRRFA